MNERYFSIMATGLRGQLEELSLDEVIVHLENFLCGMLLDIPIIGCYLQRISNDPDIQGNAKVQYYFTYLFHKMLQKKPLSLSVLRDYVRFFENDEVARRLECVSRLDHQQETMGLIADLDMRNDAEEMTEFLLKLLKMYPNYVRAAQMLLEIDFFLARKPSWLLSFRCPEEVQPVWKRMIFNYFAGTAQYEKAMPLWKSLAHQSIDEFTLNNAAEMHIALGIEKTGKNLYKSSLTIDPLQGPVHFRLQQLERPFTKQPDLLESRKICIYLYSYNKAEQLQDTLKSLASTSISGATIRVLVNGCTDDTLQVARAAKDLFPGHDYDIIDLPVNIGAPAARNYLIHQDVTWQSDYVAFLDDDVLLQSDWLEWFVSVMEMDDGIGVVGCKIVHNGQPKRIQYLFRHVNVAYHELLKLSLNAPVDVYDNHLYDFVVETRNVMGCCHMFRTKALRDVPQFDIRYSPSQIDDIDHDIELCLKGWKVYYCGLVTCVHLQSSGWGVTAPVSEASFGNIMGNDIKFYTKHAERLDELRKLDNLSLDAVREWGVLPVRV